MRRLAFLICSLLALFSMVTFVALWAVPATAGAAPGCETSWGSLDKTSAAHSSAPITAVRSGRHECFDRLVFDLAGPAAGYRVGYVDRVVMDGSGEVVPLRGEAYLSVVVHAPAHDQDYNPTYLPANRAELADVGGYRTFRQVAWAGSFEGQTTVGLGVRARLPFRVFTLDGPGAGSRVVVDVAHTW